MSPKKKRSPTVEAPPTSAPRTVKIQVEAEALRLARAKWESSGLTDTHAKRLHLRPLAPAETGALGPNFHKVRALKLPYFDLKGKETRFFRARYLEPLPDFAGVVKKPQRYAQSKGSLNEVYFPPLLKIEGKETSWAEVAKDTSIPIDITEGELKAACACVLEFACVGLGGVDQWRSSKKGFFLLPGLVAIKWEDRPVCIIYDSDSTLNLDVMRAATGLAAELAKLGAHVTIANLPAAEKCKKGGKGSFCKPDLSCGCQGLDDFIVGRTAAGEDPRAALQEVIDTASPHNLATFSALRISYQFTKSGKVVADKLSANIEAALVHLLGERIELDERAGSIVLNGKKLVEGSERNVLVADVCRFLGWHDEPKVNVLRAGIAGAAGRRAFDPVVRYLDRIPKWDGKDSLMPDLAKALGLKLKNGKADPHDIEALGKWAIGAVRRARNPGVKMDNTLVLQGEQGIKKTSAFEALAGAVGDTIAPSFTRGSHKVKDKDALMKLQGPWIVELAELASVRGAENDHVKQYLDERDDFYRPPYAESFLRRPRRVVFAGTTNDDEYLSDATGARRYWLLHVVRTIDLDWIRANADKVWAEADARAKAGEAHWYAKTPGWMKERHEAAHEDGSLEERIEEIIEKNESTWKAQGHFLWKDLLLHLGPLNHAGEVAVGRKLKRLKIKKTQRRVNGVQRKVWVRKGWTCHPVRRPSPPLKAPQGPAQASARRRRKLS